MAKTTKQTTLQSACEQYVVDELKQTKQELNATKHELELVRDELETLKRVHNHLVDCVKKGVKDFEIKTDRYINIYYKGSFIALDSNNGDMSDDFANLLALIMTGKNEVKREE